MARPGVNTWAVVVLAMAMGLVQGAVATNYVVGGPLIWQETKYGDPEFYQSWANSNFPYRISDTLEFIWSAGDSVLLVDEADFNTCNSMHPISAWVDDLQLVFPLTAYMSQRVHFISGAPGHCEGGQKFYLEVYPDS